jgi:hypothetical protein
MKKFIRLHQSDVTGVLSGFDRLRLRGTIRWLATEVGMMRFLWAIQVKLKDFVHYSQGLTTEARRYVEQLARSSGRPVQYLNRPGVSKEDVARDIARKDDIREGLICVLTNVEPCVSYQVRGNGHTKHLDLRRGLLKCLHQYLYFIDPVLGFGHVRLQTWFPFTIHVCLNGREWLCRELDRAGVAYVRRDNCLLAVQDIAFAQQQLTAQVHADWQGLLNRLAVWAFPLHQRLWNGAPLDYYWSADDTEWATDIMFRSRRRLARLYPHLVQHALHTFSSGEVLRFLGRKTTLAGEPYGQFAGEVLSELVRRPEGMRIKHRLNHNSIKMYDKQGSVLRIETTLTDARDIKVYRRVEGEPQSVRTWRRLRKGVCDLPRRTAVSQAANNRYLDALAAVEESTALKELADQVCRPVEWEGRRVRGLRPLEGEDQALLQAVMRGEFAINGFRNGDLREVLFGAEAEAAEQRRQSANVTRRLRLLRAHGLIRKIPTTHRYTLTSRGRSTITAFLAALKADTQKLSQLAA